MPKDVDIKNVVFSIEMEINSYGGRVEVGKGKKDGIDIIRYLKNPLLLWEHCRYDNALTLGIVTNLRKENGKLIGDIIFDKEQSNEEAKEYIRKYKEGFLRGFSICIKAQEFSEKDVVPGQSRATITRSELMEISCVKIPSAPGAVASVKLSDENKDEISNYIELSANGEITGLKKLKSQTNEKLMEDKILNLSLGLPENATAEERKTAVEKIKNERDAALSEKNAATEEVKKLSADRLNKLKERAAKLPDGQKETITKLSAIDINSAEETCSQFEALSVEKKNKPTPPPPKVNDFLNTGSGKGNDGNKPQDISHLSYKTTEDLAQLSAGEQEDVFKHYLG